MKKTKRICLILSILLIFALPPYTGKSITLGERDQVAIALVIDNSGSMRATDPEGKRFTASRMMLELLSASDYFSITTFTTEATDLFLMTELDAQSLNEARALLKNIPDAGGDTDYLGALTRAELSFREITEPDIRKSIIFLTDGTPDLGDESVNMDVYMDDLLRKVQSIGAQDINIYTVGFGDSDQKILTEISALTRGAAFEGDSSSISSNFFGIVQELKNQYILLDEEVSETIQDPFVLDMNEYTSRITVLIQDEDGVDSSRLVDEASDTIQPVFQADGVRLYQIDEDPARPSAEYYVTGDLSGRVLAARETKTKLWINESLQNAQFPMNASIKTQVRQTGAVGTSGELRAALSQNGTRINHPIEIKKGEERFDLSIANLPQSGVYELEVALVVRDRILTRTSSTFEVKNLPNLITNLLDESTHLVIAGEPKVITASLVRSGQTIKQGTEDLELNLELLHNGEKLAVTMRDDGTAASGDLIPGDGVYSATVSFQETGNIAGIISVRGTLLEESIFLTSGTAESRILEPGRVEIELPETIQYDGGGSVEVEMKMTSQSEYPESITVELEGSDLRFPPIPLEPQESVTSRVRVEVPSSQEENGLNFTFRPQYGATRIDSARNRVLLSNAMAKNRAIPTELLFGAGALILLIAGFLLLRKKPKHQKSLRLRGNLRYQDPKDGSAAVVPLAGTNPIICSIGPGEKSSHHIPADVEPGFSFTVYPISSDKENKVVELKCHPPGVLISHGQVKSSTLLSQGDEFTMGGILFKYTLDEEEVAGKDVLMNRA